MQWNLHLVGESLETELNDVLAKLIADLESIGHKLTSATLTTDAGPTALPTTPLDPTSEPVQTVGGEPVTPPAAPVVSTPAPADSTPTSPFPIPTDTPPSL